MGDKSIFIYMVGKQIREPKTAKPCNTCYYGVGTCPKAMDRCTRYEMWFAGEWHRIQRMFKK